MFTSALLILAGAAPGAVIGYCVGFHRAWSAGRIGCDHEGDGAEHGPAAICDTCYRGALHQALRCLKER